MRVQWTTLPSIDGNLKRGIIAGLAASNRTLVDIGMSMTQQPAAHLHSRGQWSWFIKSGPLFTLPAEAVHLWTTHGGGGVSGRFGRSRPRGQSIYSVSVLDWFRTKRCRDCGGAGGGTCIAGQPEPPGPLPTPGPGTRCEWLQKSLPTHASTETGKWQWVDYLTD